MLPTLALHASHHPICCALRLPVQKGKPKCVIPCNTATKTCDPALYSFCMMEVGRRRAHCFTCGAHSFACWLAIAGQAGRICGWQLPVLVPPLTTCKATRSPLASLFKHHPLPHNAPPAPVWSQPPPLPASPGTPCRASGPFACRSAAPRSKNARSQRPVCWTR